MSKHGSIAAIQKALASGETNSESVVTECLQRVTAADPHLHAFAVVLPERALAEARHLDALTRLGVPLGPLHGVPMAVKDLIDVAGVPTQGGSLTRADAPAAIGDAAVVRLLRSAGAVIVGKTHTVEYAFGGWGTNETIGTPVNPWDMATPRVPGGSSSGSGVAVAAGLVSTALGSDTGGSIRMPASFCGIVGLKTTAGLIDKTGVLPLCDALDTLGPMATCVADAAALLRVLAPPQDHLVPDWSPRLADLGSGIVGDLHGIRIGVVADMGVALHPETRRIYEETLTRLQKLGASLLDVRLPASFADVATVFGEHLATEAYQRYGHFAEEEPNRLGPAVRRRILSGRAVPAHRHLANLEQRQRDMRAMRIIFTLVDALLMPSTAFPAPTLAEHDPDLSPGIFTRLANWYDLAAISLPMGLAKGGLPVGMQIVVPGLHEPDALAIAAALEQDL